MYFRVSDLTTRYIDEEYLSSYPAYLTMEVQPMQGPGYDYHPLEELTARKNIRQVMLSRGSRVNALFEMNGWVFAEFTCVLGTARAWIPSSYVESR